MELKTGEYYLKEECLTYYKNLWYNENYSVNTVTGNEEKTALIPITKLQKTPASPNNKKDTGYDNIWY